MSEQPIVPPTQAEIERQRKRFESAEKKLNKLYDALDKFERKFENIDALSSWLESMLGNKTKIEELTVSFSKDVAERKSSMDVTQNEVTQKAEDLFTKLEEDEGKFYDQLDNKTEDASKLFDEKIKAMEDRSDEKLGELENLLEEASKSKEKIDSIEKSSNLIGQKISDTELRIQRTLKDAEKALTSATAAGLAKEFETRRKDLFTTQKWWVFGLISSLVLALVIAFFRLHSMQELLIKPEKAAGSIIFLNILISVLSIAAPVWFAWVSTKQIGYCFRLSEDYGFKASIAAAYEGFRKEIEQLPPEEGSDMEDDLRIKLLDSILKTLDERPLRYVEQKYMEAPSMSFYPSLKIKSKLKVKNKPLPPSFGGFSIHVPSPSSARGFFIGIKLCPHLTNSPPLSAHLLHQSQNQRRKLPRSFNRSFPTSLKSNSPWPSQNI